MQRLLQFTDLHLRDDPAAVVRGVVPQRSFEETIYHAQRHRWPADAILLTGDLANDEFDNSYRRLAAMAMRWETPLHAIPGNHDDGAALRAAFARVPLAGDGVLDLGAWRVIALDSQIPGAVHGALGDAALRMLEQAVATRAQRHVLVALHHPPLALQSHWLDRLGLEDGDAFRARLAKLGVRACVFGHAHQEWDSVEDGVRYLGTPSTSRQFLPRSPRFAESDAPPAYRWLHLHDDGGIDTAVEWVEQ